MKNTILFSAVLLILILPSATASDCIWVPSDIYGDSFETFLTTHMTNYHIKSVAFSVLNGTEVFYTKGFGEQSGTDIAYYMASACKMFTGVAILQLYEQGLLGLDDDINNYLNYTIRSPYFPDTPITIKHLLAHRSAIVSDEDSWDTYWMPLDSGAYSFPDILYEFLNVNGSIYSTDNWYTWEPGTNAVYTDVAFDILTVIIENITGQPYFDYVENNILLPLGMLNTKPFPEDYSPDKLAVGYQWNQSSSTNQITPYLKTYNDPGGGGYFSTVEDMSKFMLAHLNQGEYNGIRILNVTSIEIMHTEIETAKWALGWRVRQHYSSFSDYEGHGGGPWAGFCVRIYIRQTIGVVLFLNQEYLPHEEELFGKIGDLANKLLTEKTCTTEGIFSLLPALILFSTFIVIVKIRRRKN